MYTPYFFPPHSSSVEFSQGLTLHHGRLVRRPSAQVLLIQMQGANNGQYQFAKVASVSGNSFVVDRALRIPYITSGISTAQVVMVCPRLPTHIHTIP